VRTEIIILFDRRISLDSVPAHSSLKIIEDLTQD
jgi:hypothetical protein